MANLKTEYLGMELKNPIILGASNLVNNLENIKKAEKAGAAAVVFKSLFEEQIQYERMQLQEDLEEYEERHAEMTSLFPTLEHAGPREHLMNLRKAKDAVKIPIIASLNCVYKETWLEYAKLIEDTGVDAIELNFYSVPKEKEISGSDIIAEQLEIIKDVKEALSIPVSVKLSPFYVAPLNVIDRMDQAGVDGFVLFNRLFQPDIDLDKEEHITPFGTTRTEDSRLPLRFAGMLYDNINASICSNTGISTGPDVARMVLAGADCVQVVSTLYQNNIDYVGSMLKDLEAWMKSKNYSNLKDFRGKLSQKNISDPFIYKRAQYVDILMRSEEIFKKNPLG